MAKEKKQVPVSVRMTLNKAVKVRNDSVAGRDYLVVPMVMLTEGVHNGSEGPYLYEASEISKRPEMWNMKPVVDYHPDEPTATLKEVLNARQVGIIMNTQWDGKNNRLLAEAWLDEARCNKVDKRILEAVKNGQVLELSTGLFADSDETPGKWNGKDYQGTLKNFGPDHLAILPDQVGACSIADGAGFFRNADGQEVKLSPYQMTHHNELTASVLRTELNKAVHAATGQYCYVEDWSEEKSYLIYSTEKGGLYTQSYAIKGNEVTLKGEPVEVIMKRTYEPVKKNLQNGKEKRSMDKEKIVSQLIANKTFGDDDRKMLMGLDERVLTNMLPKETPKVEPETPKADEPKQNAHPAKKTLDEYLAEMPAEVASTVRNAMAVEEAEKVRLIDVIQKKPNNEFKPEWLKTQDLPFLRNLSKIGEGPKSDEPKSDERFFNYGMGDPAPVNNDSCKGVPVLEANSVMPKANSVMPKKDAA